MNAPHGTTQGSHSRPNRIGCGVPGHDLECVGCGKRLYGEVCPDSIPANTDERTVEQVIHAQTHLAIYGGCCERFADHSPCDCLQRAADRWARRNER